MRQLALTLFIMCCPETVAFSSIKMIRSPPRVSQIWGAPDDFSTQLDKISVDGQPTSPSFSLPHSTWFVPILSTILATPSAAWAAGPDWGLFEGRIGSLIHPTVMTTMFIYSIATALLGFQYRRQRTINDDIKAVQNQLKSVQPKINNTATDSEENAGAKVDDGSAAKARDLEKQLDDLKKERKDLTASQPRDKHFNQGALLVFLGTASAIGGPLNTYARAGKLFPGPHLYAGAALVVCWALASSCVPYMIKGDDTARTVHIGANLLGLGLFGWQVVSGIPILLKVIENTQWP